MVRQRLVTVYVWETTGAGQPSKGTVTDHLGPELEEGWMIRAIAGVGAGVGAGPHEPRGWGAVLLERSHP
jgi:hypothetical protein